jgi:hypothetical protein
MTAKRRGTYVAVGRIDDEDEGVVVLVVVPPEPGLKGESARGLQGESARGLQGESARASEFQCCHAFSYPPSSFPSFLPTFASGLAPPRPR